MHALDAGRRAAVSVPPAGSIETTPWSTSTLSPGFKRP